MKPTLKITDTLIQRVDEAMLKTAAADLATTETTKARRISIIRAALAVVQTEGEFVETETVPMEGFLKNPGDAVLAALKKD